VKIRLHPTWVVLKLIRVSFVIISGINSQEAKPEQQIHDRSKLCVRVFSVPQSFSRLQVLKGSLGCQ